jgi:hypothetical protein
VWSSQSDLNKISAKILLICSNAIILGLELRLLILFFPKSILDDFALFPRIRVVSVSHEGVLHRGSRIAWLWRWAPLGACAVLGETDVAMELLHITP